MCDTCGCNITESNQHATTKQDVEVVEVLQDLMQKNNHDAAHNREHFNRHQVLAINLMSSPGSGKTALLEQTIEGLKDKYSIAVIEGDLETENDAKRIRDKGVPAIQITTGSACHLDAAMVHKALHELQLENIDILFIENVGNLVCPASFDLGHHLNVVLLSVTEGDDKPAKYPVMFRAADCVIISKTDLLDYIDDFKPGNVKHVMQQLASDAEIAEVSCKRTVNIQPWLAWLERQLSDIKDGGVKLPNMQQDGHAYHSHNENELPINAG